MEFVMSEVSFSSGEWVGYYMYLNLPNMCPMHLTLQFLAGKVKGAGIDNPGQFVVEGDYFEETGLSKFVKRYVGKHSLEYVGKLRDGKLTGTWSLNQMKDGKLVTLQGEFRIWPLPEGKYGDDESLQSILDREIREETEQLNLRRTGERPEN
jgi:hypothetical protein